MYLRRVSLLPTSRDQCPVCSSRLESPWSFTRNIYVNCPRCGLFGLTHWRRAHAPGFADDFAEGGCSQLRHSQDAEAHRPGLAVSLDPTRVGRDASRVAEAHPILQRPALHAHLLLFSLREASKVSLCMPQ